MMMNNATNPVTARVDGINASLRRNGAPFSAEVVSSFKPNIGELFGYSLIPEEREGACPIIYWSPELNHMSDGEIADMMTTVYRQKSIDPAILPDLSREGIMQSVLPKVLSAEKNIPALEEKGIPFVQIPHTDLITVFYIPCEGQQDTSITVDGRMVLGTGLKISELLIAAGRNVEAQMTVTSIQSAIRGLLEADMDDTDYAVPLTVVSTKRSAYGAGVLAGGSRIFHEISRKIHADDFWILPSSIHEILCLPAAGSSDAEGLLKMVKEVNAIVVAPDEVLSDSVYRYSCKTETLSCYTA